MQFIEEFYSKAGEIKHSSILTPINNLEVIFDT